jgi:hypothetical protein
MLGWFVILCLLALGATSGAPSALAAELRAGVADVLITPLPPGVQGAPELFRTQEPLYLDGYYANRPQSAVHDDLHVKALVLDDGEKRIALLSLDLIYLFAQWVDVIKHGALGFDPANVIVTCTHTHSAPCTIGIFGPPGKAVNLDYVSWVIGRSIQAISQAAANLRPARIAFGRAELPITVEEREGKPERVMANVAHNWHNPGVFDPSVTVMVVRDAKSGENIATMVNFGSHPDALPAASTVVSADWPMYLYREVSKALGGVTVFVNGALGGIEPANMSGSEEWLERMGTTLAKTAIEAARAAEPVEQPTIKVACERVRFPVTTPDILKAIRAGIIPVQLDADRTTCCDMEVIAIGPAEMITIPGEPHPEFTAKLKEIMTGRYEFVLAVANHCLGYFVAKETWNAHGVQESLSAGEKIEEVALAAARSLHTAVNSPPARATW